MIALKSGPAPTDPPDVAGRKFLLS